MQIPRPSAFVIAIQSLVAPELKIFLAERNHSVVWQAALHLVRNASILKQALTGASRIAPACARRGLATLSQGERDKVTCDFAECLKLAENVNHALEKHLREARLCLLADH